ncbi:MAG TPA: DUF2950 domain-containing protein [Candidatus Solibacter sp.]|nr:DUF2950 domain-containing protein [Candidatus Solibacter sp.]
MQGRKIRFTTTFGARHTTTAAFAIFALLVACAPASFAQRSAQAAFSSPEEASRALFAAVKDDNDEAMMEILGCGKELVSLEDKSQDKLEREEFVIKYQEMHRLVREPDHTTVLYIGAENWPFPVPLVSRKGGWYFDSNTGMREVLFRRIGENEEAAIEASHLLVLAEERYRATLHSDDSTSHYALRFVSDQNTQDGLYSDEGSPIPPFLANAGVGNGVPQENKQAPYAGYYFRILTQQGKNAPGGTQNYISNGKLTGGFAFVAYPAEYGQSGVMTFIVNQNNVVYQKDLGPRTPNVVQTMTRYNPGPGWRRVE